MKKFAKNSVELYITEKLQKNLTRILRSEKVAKFFVSDVYQNIFDVLTQRKSYRIIRLQLFLISENSLNCNI
jgi:hypothetical protein